MSSVVSSHLTSRGTIPVEPVASSAGAEENAHQLLWCSMLLIHWRAPNVELVEIHNVNILSNSWLSSISNVIYVRLPWWGSHKTQSVIYECISLCINYNKATPVYDSWFPITTGWMKHAGKSFIIHYSLFQSLNVKLLLTVIIIHTD